MSTWSTVLVGVDGSDSSHQALTWAAAEAADHGAELVVLQVWEHHLPPPGGSVGVPDRAGPEPGRPTPEDLLQEITGVLGEQPPVRVQPRIEEGNAARLLIERSQEADLLVVGTR